MADLEVKRDHAHGYPPIVRPFINGWNVWSIPEKEWTEDVQAAILHAYELGWMQCNQQHSQVKDFAFPLNGKKWKEN